MRFENLKYEHLEQMVEIEKEAFDTPWSVAMFIPEISDPSAVYVVGVMSEGEVVCYGGFHHVLDEAHITNIAVKASERGKGYGKFLMSELLQRARDLELKSVTLEVKDINYRAIKMYQEFGFKVEGVRPKYYNNTNDALIMWLTL